MIGVGVFVVSLLVAALSGLSYPWAKMIGVVLGSWSLGRGRDRDFPRPGQVIAFEERLAGLRAGAIPEETAARIA